MNGGKLGRVALIAVAALVLGLVVAAPAAQARKKVVTKEFEVGVGAPAGGVPLNIPDGGGGAVQLVRDPYRGQGSQPARQDQTRQCRRSHSASVRQGHRDLSGEPARRDQPLARRRRRRQQLRRRTGGCAGTFTTFDSNTPTRIDTPGLQAPFAGFFAPIESLNQLTGLGDKKATNAAWSLLVEDDDNAHPAGTLACWYLQIKTTNPNK